MLTSQEGAETEVNILKDGADDYIPKPLQPDKIYLRIRNILIRTYGEVLYLTIPNKIHGNRTTLNKSYIT